MSEISGRNTIASLSTQPHVSSAPKEGREDACEKAVANGRNALRVMRGFNTAKLKPKQIKEYILFD